MRMDLRRVLARTGWRGSALRALTVSMLLFPGTASADGHYWSQAMF